MSKESISRNAPCPCGSGKKYKLCCLKKETVETPEVLWQRLREVDRKLSERLLKYAIDIEEDYSPFYAWEEFVAYDEERDLDWKSPENQAFIPWFLFEWRPSVEVEDDEDFAFYELPTIAESYVARYGSRLSEMEHRFIEACASANFSFYEILDCQPGIGFLLKDILRDQEVFVTESSGSRDAQKGYILFARVMRYKDVRLLAGCSPILITPGYKTQIIDLRSQMLSDGGGLINEDDLYEWDTEIRDLYLWIYDRMHKPPKLTNTDGDDMCLHDLFFEVSSAQVAFEQLSSLAVGVSAAELLEDGEFDKIGILKGIEFPWLVAANKPKTGMENIVFANLKIQGQELIVSVNSRKRAQKARAEIKKCMGKDATLLETKITPVDFSHQSKSDPAEKLDDINKTPEGRAIVRQVLEKHWREWIDSELPALGGLTPRQAVKDVDGREKVAALLDDFERLEHSKSVQQNQLHFIQRTRKELGLS